MLILNEKLSEVQLLRLRATFHGLPLFYLRTYIFLTYARKNYATLEINPKSLKNGSDRLRKEKLRPGGGVINQFLFGGAPPLGLTPSANLCTIFYEKGTPFLLTNGTPFTYLV